MPIEDMHMHVSVGTELELELEHDPRGPEAQAAARAMLTGIKAAAAFVESKKCANGCTDCDWERARKAFVDALRDLVVVENGEGMGDKLLRRFLKAEPREAVEPKNRSQAS